MYNEASRLPSISIKSACVGSTHFAIQISERFFFFSLFPLSFINIYGFIPIYLCSISRKHCTLCFCVFRYSIQKIRFVEVLFVFLYLEYKYDYRKNVEILWKYALHIVNFAQACTSQSYTVHMAKAIQMLLLLN